jgi:hypothetical protein
MPTPDRAAIVAALHRVVDAVNAQLPKGRRLAKAPETVLVGPGGTLDSLMLMNLVVETEGRMQEDFGLQVGLADVIGLPAEENPFRTLGTLTDHLAALAAA